MIRNLKFSLLAKRHTDEIYRFSKGMLGDSMEAEDATQEVLLTLWTHLDKVELLGARAWLYRTARNHCVDRIRRRQAVHQPVFVDHDALPEPGTGAGDDPNRQADCATLKQRIDSAISALPETLRSVFVLYEINGLRYREIATTLDIPTNSVKVYLSRARKKLQERLKEDQAWINA